MAGRRRLDAELVRRRLASSRTEAQRLIEDGRVRVAGSLATKAATMVAPEDAVAVDAALGPQWASRAGSKLAGALDRLGLDVRGRHALDAGAAHGGFTDVLLHRGVASVVAVDVAYGQLDWRLRSDSRVSVLERTNVRFLSPGDVPGPAPNLVVADLSFISLRLVLPALAAVAAPDAHFALMVKPQFEAGREAVGKGGVVRDPQAWAAAVRTVTEAAADLGLRLAGVAVSPLPGPAGNVEFFVHLCADADGDVDELLVPALAEARTLAGLSP